MVWSRIYIPPCKELNFVQQHPGYFNFVSQLSLLLEKLDSLRSSVVKEDDLWLKGMKATTLKHVTKMLAVLEGMSLSAERMSASVNQVEDEVFDLEESISRTDLSKSISVSTATIIRWR